MICFGWRDKCELLEGIIEFKKFIDSLVGIYKLLFSKRIYVAYCICPCRFHVKVSQPRWHALSDLKLHFFCNSRPVSGSSINYILDYCYVRESKRNR